MSARSLLALAALALTYSALPSQLKADDSPQQATIENSTKIASQEELAFFESKIRPLLLQRCVECHSDESPESGLSLESKAGLLRGGELGKAVVPTKPKESLLISAVNHDEFLKMPPKDKLPTVELALLTKWVAMGAPWPEPKATGPESAKLQVTSSADSNGTASTSVTLNWTDEQKSFWAFQPFQRPPLPRLKSNERLESAIDLFIFEKLHEKGITPAPPATKRDLIRRATYDLIGLPPTAEEIQSFLDDASPTAFQVVVERLLASPRYGEKWGRHWLDVARFAESNGLDENIAYANAFRYRDYVISSFNSDKPYNRFVQEQIAGDLLPDEHHDQPTYDRFVATGFLAIGAKMLAEDDPVKMQMDIIDEQLNTLCQAFMGLTIGCARCHDHKFDPIPTTDYYALAGIFKSTKTMENHRVVAKWFERPLASPPEIHQIQAIDREIDRIQAAMAKLQKESSARVNREMRESIGQYLLAAAEYDRYFSPINNSTIRGLLESGTYPVKDGYALIEAEGFHRGGAERDTEKYGQDIGVVLSSGAIDVEYDLEVAVAGKYAIELRYASKESRPIRVLVDGAEINPAAATDTTSNWQPDSQTWCVAGLVDLDQGKHVLRFESKTPLPHLDKIAIVFQSEHEWPFGTEPVSLSRWSSKRKVSWPLLTLWRNYLDLQQPDSEEKPSTRRSFFELWYRLSDSQIHFDSAVTQSIEDLQQDSELRRQTPSILRQSVLAKRPETIEQLAATYQATINQILAGKDNSEESGSNSDPDREQTTDRGEITQLREEFNSKNSPLAVVKRNAERYYSSAEQSKAGQFAMDLDALEKQKPSPPMAMGTTEAKPEDLRVHLRGSHVVLGKLVSRGFPKILAGENQTPLPQSTSGRLELAHWMTQPNHPLTSRVIANRIWHWHFGQGLVTSVDNFGMLGQQPSHPELLDWLASELVDSDWSIKQLHRTIMLSQTYQMSTQYHSTAAELDPENQLRWRFQRRRLTAEETRDSILSVGSGIDHTMYGSLMSVKNHSYVNTTGGAGSVNYSSPRRTIYLPIIRSGVFDLLQTLDFPDPAMINGSRQTSTVAPQALLMMNSDLVFEQSKDIVEQSMPSWFDDAQRISTAYRRILNRPPTLDEIVAAATYLKSLREKLSTNPTVATTESASPDQLIWQSFCRVLISSNEFSYIE